MLHHNILNDTVVRSKIKNGAIKFGGNKNLKIYGTLKCKSGLRMKKENRIFFLSIQDALKNDYRPCGHCMREAYKKWKNEII